VDDLAVEDLDEDMDGKSEWRRGGVAVSGATLVGLRPRECLLLGDIENEEVGLRIIIVDWRNISGAGSGPVISSGKGFCSLCSTSNGEPSLWSEDNGVNDPWMVLKCICGL
jgi:hypothetical protein